jgi:hypothetical protein
MSNSAHKHSRSGKREKAPKREPSIDKNLICFLEAKGLYQKGRHGIDFRTRKNLDGKRAA